MPATMRPNLRQGFLKGSFRLFGGRFRSNLGGHVVQMFPQVPGVPAVLVFKGSRDDMSKVALGRHTGGARLSFKRGGILLRQVNRQVHGLLLQVSRSPVYAKPARGVHVYYSAIESMITTTTDATGPPLFYLLSCVFPLVVCGKQKERVWRDCGAANPGCLRLSAGGLAGESACPTPAARPPTLPVGLTGLNNGRVEVGRGC